jgi:hypothetical protein
MSYRITLRQTTYWDFKRGGRIERVHFRGKEEYRSAGGEVESYSVQDEHPVLLDYRWAWRKVVIARPVAAWGEVLTDISMAIEQIVGPWRAAAHYLNHAFAEAIIRDGYGALLSAPIPVAHACCGVLDKHCARYTVLPGNPARWPRRVLVAGSNYVVAASFRIESIDD